MKKYLLSPDKAFYKANLHCHSTYSDGTCTPSELKQMYKEKGYSILAITDHEGLFDHSYLNDEEFITLPGYEREINSPEIEGGSWNSVVVCHLCFYPKSLDNMAQTCFDPEFIHPKFRWMHTPELRERIKYIGEPYKPSYSVESINHIIEEANKNGFLVTLNHIQWSQEKYEQYGEYKGLFAMEIYNTSCERMGLNEYNSAAYDMMLRKGYKMRCVAADDNHNFEPVTSPYSDSFGGFVMVNAENLSHKDVISALENGEFYASTGPAIEELYVEDERVHIKCSPVKKIRLITDNRYSKVIFEEDKPLTQTSFYIGGVKGYYRIEITDANGEKAYTNAYFA